MALESLIPAPLPIHVSIVRRHANWMHRRSGRTRGLFIFQMAFGGGGSVDFCTASQVPVSRLMALDLAEEIACSVRHRVESYDADRQVMALVVDRSEAHAVSFSLVEVEL